MRPRIFTAASDKTETCDKGKAAYTTLASFTGLLIITTAQHSTLDLVRVGSEIEAEKDALLEKVSSVYNES